jgi:hypothetical protein
MLLSAGADSTGFQQGRWARISAPFTAHRIGSVQLHNCHIWVGKSAATLIPLAYCAPRHIILQCGTRWLSRARSPPLGVSSLDLGRLPRRRPFLLAQGPRSSARDRSNATTAGYRARADHARPSDGATPDVVYRPARTASSDPQRPHHRDHKIKRRMVPCQAVQARRFLRYRLARARYLQVSQSQQSNNNK